MPTMAMPEEPKTSWPRISLNGDQAKALGLDTCAIGDTYEITLHIKAVRLGGDNYEMRGSDLPPAEFDVISATDAPTEVADGDTAEEEDAEKDTAPDKPKARVKSPADSGFKAAYKD